MAPNGLTCQRSLVQVQYRPPFPTLAALALADRVGPNTARPAETPRLLRDRGLGLFSPSYHPRNEGRASVALPACPAPLQEPLFNLDLASVGASPCICGDRG